ncbi:hypothetical protein HMN09_01091700 [Mycena chlorophos]|uniref:GPI anchored cell wall protein n=1 Tax=Mycena chlorophos TaxID=658473 RepID=A0A8H6SC38_MYCCL|nr:hypothetical protein HMN09_01091700 [Mycena chlorophos]
MFASLLFFAPLLSVFHLLPAVSALPAPTGNAPLTTLTIEGVSFDIPTISVSGLSALVSQTEEIIAQGTSTGANGAAVTTYLEEDIVSFEADVVSGSTFNALSAPVTLQNIIAYSSGGFSLSAVPTASGDGEENESCTFNADGTASCVFVDQIAAVDPTPITTTMTGTVVPTTIVEPLPTQTSKNGARHVGEGALSGAMLGGLFFVLSILV